jgi:epoxide hydrolase
MEAAAAPHLLAPAQHRRRTTDLARATPLCRTAGSSIRFYYEDAKAENPTEPTTVPIGLAGFANDFQSIRRFAERDHKSITQWHTFDVGGHYAAHQVPEVLAGDVREFFTNLS